MERSPSLVASSPGYCVPLWLDPEIEPAKKWEIPKSQTAHPVRFPVERPAQPA
jgi:hypothetical protein